MYSNMRTKSRTALKNVGLINLTLWLMKRLTMNFMRFYKNFVPTQQSKNFWNLMIALTPVSL